MSVYNQPFTLAAAQAIESDLTIENLWELSNRSILQELPQRQFDFLPLIKRFAQSLAGDQSHAHEMAAAYYQKQCVPLLRDTPSIALAAYLGLFDHACELGHYAAAWSVMQTRTVEDELNGRYSSCEMFLKFQGSGSDRLQLRDLYARLVTQWQPQDLQEQIQFADALNAIGDVLQFLKQSTDALSRYDEALSIYRDVGARLGEANTLKAIGDVLQFLDQRTDALSRYDEALSIYRDVGARLGEANVLLELGSLQKDAEQAMDYFTRAQTIYEQIGDRYSQGRTLLLYIVPTQTQLKDTKGALQSLEQAKAIGMAINFEPFQQAADQMRAELMTAIEQAEESPSSDD